MQTIIAPLAATCLGPCAGPKRSMFFRTVLLAIFDFPESIGHLCPRVALIVARCLLLDACCLLLVVASSHSQVIAVLFFNLKQHLALCDRRCCCYL